MVVAEDLLKILQDSLPTLPTLQQETSHYDFLKKLTKINNNTTITLKIITQLDTLPLKQPPKTKTLVHHNNGTIVEVTSK